jgi:hypothetical protein
MLAKLAVFSLAILWCSQNGDQPDLAIYQIWKLPKKSSTFLVTHLNLSFKNGDLEFLEFLKIDKFESVYQWISFVSGFFSHFFP